MQQFVIEKDTYIHVALAKTDTIMPISNSS